MSGGSYDYACYKVETEYVGNMHDIEMDEMMEDLVKVLHDVEWWQSADISEEDYRFTLDNFKSKWFGERDERIRELLAEQLNKVIKIVLET